MYLSSMLRGGGRVGGVTPSTNNRKYIKCSNCPRCWWCEEGQNKNMHAQKEDAHRSHCPAAGWGFPPPLSWWSLPLCSGSSWTAEQRQYHCKKHTTQSIIYLVITARANHKPQSPLWHDICCMSFPIWPSSCFLSSLYCCYPIKHLKCPSQVSMSKTLRLF